jgi:hypothetical protein
MDGERERRTLGEGRRRVDYSLLHIGRLVLGGSGRIGHVISLSFSRDGGIGRGDGVGSFKVSAAGSVNDL